MAAARTALPAPSGGKRASTPRSLCLAGFVLLAFNLGSSTTPFRSPSRIVFLRSATGRAQILAEYSKSSAGAVAAKQRQAVWVAGSCEPRFLVRHPRRWRVKPWQRKRLETVAVENVTALARARLCIFDLTVRSWSSPTCSKLTAQTPSRMASFCLSKIRLLKVAGAVKLETKLDRLANVLAFAIVLRRLNYRHGAVFLTAWQTFLVDCSWKLDQKHEKTYPGSSITSPVHPSPIAVSGLSLSLRDFYLEQKSMIYFPPSFM